MNPIIFAKKTIGRATSITFSVPDFLGDSEPGVLRFSWFAFNNGDHDLTVSLNCADNSGASLVSTKVLAAGEGASEVLIFNFKDSGTAPTLAFIPAGGWTGTYDGYLVVERLVLPPQLAWNVV